MIYTSYFAKMKSMREQEKEKCIAVSVSKPKGIEIETYTDLVPIYYLVRDKKLGAISEEDYTKIYNEHLDKLDVHKVAKELDGKILLCWCGKDKFCHRHLIAKWLLKNGYDCREI